MRHTTKKVAVALLSVIFALTLMMPMLSFAQTTPVSSMTGLITAVTETDSCEIPADPNPSSASNASSASSAAPSDDEPSGRIITAASGEPRPGEPSAEIRVAGDCTATIKYMEYLWEEDPRIPTDTDEGGRALLGTYEVTGLHEGDVLNAWDYVVDIPGHFFFDGWPYSLTVSKDPAQNVFTLVYVKYWDCEYTVNYYVMEGADLTASNWTDALKPDDVKFTKVDSETFNGQIYDTLVKGDAYEYQVDGMYVIDTYPAEIRVGMEPDDNVINVLYTATYATGPDSFEVPDDYAVPDGVPMPDDSTVDKDDIIGALPDGAAPGDEIYDDFLGTTVRPGELVVTDEMLQHPVNKEQATLTAQAYATGLQQSGLAQTGDIAPWVIGGLVVLVIGMAVFIVWLARQGHRVDTEANR